MGLKLLSKLPFHSLVFAAFPIVSLMASNVAEARPVVGARSLVLVVILVALLLLATRRLIGNWHRAALASSLFLVLIFSYGSAYDSLNSVAVAGSDLGRHRYLLPLWLALSVVGLWFALRRLPNPERLTGPANVAALAMLALAVIQLGAGELERNSLREQSPTSVQIGAAIERRARSADSLPDIYLIILDAYTRADTLEREFGFDNRPFIRALESRGFSVADCGVSSYAQTELSFASTLNLDFIQNLVPDPGVDADRSVLWPLIRSSLVREVLEGSGYRTVAFETGFRWSELEDADSYLSSPTRAPIGLNSFEATLLRSTVFWALADVTNWVPDFLLKDFDRSAEEHYLRVQFVLDRLGTLHDLPGPKFVFAHIVSPHGPHVFRPDGEFVDRSSFDDSLSDRVFSDGYLDQIRYLNSRLLPIIDALLDQPGPDPVILLQADHGPERGSSADRMTVFNAMYLPDASSGLLPADRSLVNTFRWVFNAEFQADLEYLPDSSYYSTYGAPFGFQEIPNHCQPGGGI